MRLTVTFVVLLFCGLSTLRAQNDIYLDTIIINKEVSEVVQVEFKESGFKHDTCRNRSESFSIFLPLKNESGFEIFTQKSMMVWYDSGFYIRGISNPLFIKADSSASIEMKIAPASRRTMRRAGLIPVKSNSFEHPGVRVRLELNYSNHGCEMK